MSDKAKSVQVWRYVVPPMRHQGWGIFLISSDGMVAVVSDHGNYVFMWTHFGGGDFRAWFADMPDSDYMMGKLAPSESHAFDARKTQEVIREHLEAERNGRLSEEQVRRELARVERITCEDEFAHWVGKTTIPDAYEFCIRGLSVQCRHFYEKVYKRLVPLLLADIAANPLPVDPALPHGDSAQDSSAQEVA